MITGGSWRFWMFMAGLALTVAVFLLAWAYPNFPGDERALRSIQSLETNWLDAIARWLDAMGELPVVAALMGGVTLAFFVMGRRADAAMVVTGTILLGVGQALKLAVGRARPEQLVAGAESSGFAFPSGHSVYAMLFGGLLILFASQLIQPLWPRRLVQAGVVVWVAAMGGSRVYLGVHWPSDVIGGFMFGAISLTLIIMLRNTLNSEGC